jgi:hypothetical protein
MFSSPLPTSGDSLFTGASAFSLWIHPEMKTIPANKNIRKTVPVFNSYMASAPDSRKTAQH